MVAPRSALRTVGSSARASAWRSRLALCAFALVFAACTEAAPSPSQTVRDFVQAMDRSHRVPEALKDAYALLDAPARAALSERAERATTLAGRHYEAWEMLAQGRFRLRFASAAVGGLRERIKGDHAVVLVSGKSSGERAEVPMVREQGRWRITLQLPPLRRAEPTAPSSPPAAPAGAETAPVAAPALSAQGPAPATSAKVPQPPEVKSASPQASATPEAAPSAAPSSLAP